MTFPILRHQQAAKLRVSGKSYAEEIEDLALKIVRARPQRRERFNRRTRAVEPHLQPHSLLLGNREQMVNQFKPRLRRIPIDASDIRKKLECAFRVVPQQSAGLANVRPIHEK